MPLESVLASFASWLRLECAGGRTEIDIEKSARSGWFLCSLHLILFYFIFLLRLTKMWVKMRHWFSSAFVIVTAFTFLVIFEMYFFSSLCCCSAFPACCLLSFNVLLSFCCFAFALFLVQLDCFLVICFVVVTAMFYFILLFLLTSLSMLLILIM